MFDVIVIGAGLAGSTASKILAEKGFHVLLAERLKMPRYKLCFGQLIKKSLDLVQKYYEFSDRHQCQSDFDRFLELEESVKEQE